jgi:nucleotide-binding universal stress UspA family protein
MLSYTLPKEYDVDLIVLGATGMGTVAQVILGSTASYVVENAAPDVVIVKNN